MLSLNDVAIAVDGKTILEGLSYQIKPGELVGLSGPSGSGKTTLLRAIAGLIDIQSGEITFNGKPREADGMPRYRRQVVLFDQQPRMLDATVMQNLQRPFLYKSAKREAFPVDRAMMLLRKVGIDNDLLERNARRLSVGQQLRISLVRGLLVKPTVALLDEPASALDDDATQTIEVLIRSEARERGLGALIVTHDKDQTRRWCDRLYSIVTSDESASKLVLEEL